MKRRMLFLVLTIVSALPALCQGLNEGIIRRYATQDYMRELMAAHPEMVVERSAIERHVFDFRQNAILDTPTIAVIFHLVGSAGESLSPDDIATQLAFLNADFYLPNPPDAAGLNDAWQLEGYAERTARPSIRFCLADQAPDGSTSAGYQYISSTVSSFPVGEAISTAESGGYPAWDPNKYLNVWVGQLDGQIAGFAQMPGGPIATDGVVIHADFFARKDTQSFILEHPAMASYVGGRTLSHLIGSYLNLFELWNDEYPCSDDYVDDTPIHNAPNNGKPTYRHVSTCEDNPIEMTMNIMDNSDDDAQFMFTHGQILRMYATLAPNGPRGGLRKSNIQCLEPLGLRPPSQGVGTASREATTNFVEEALLEVYPNPANDGFSIRAKIGCDRELQLDVYDQLGKLFFQKKVIPTADPFVEVVEKIDARSWPSGIYKVQLSCGPDLKSTTLLLGH